MHWHQLHWSTAADLLHYPLHWIVALLALSMRKIEIFFKKEKAFTKFHRDDHSRNVKQPFCVNLFAFLFTKFATKTHMMQFIIFYKLLEIPYILIDHGFAKRVISKTLPFNPNPHCFIAITKATACDWKEPLLPHPLHNPVRGRGKGGVSSRALNICLIKMSYT
jgi:hypothetical protein